MKEQHDLYPNNLVGDTVLRLMPESLISTLIVKILLILSKFICIVV